MSSNCSVETVVTRCCPRGSSPRSSRRPGPPTSRLRLFASTTRDNAAGEIIVKVVNAADSPKEAEIRLDGTASVSSRARAIVLTGATPAAVNSFDQPNNVAPQESAIENASTHLNHTFPAHSLTVIRVPAK